MRFLVLAIGAIGLVGCSASVPVTSVKMDGGAKAVEGSTEGRPTPSDQTVLDLGTLVPSKRPPSTGVQVGQGQAANQTPTTPTTPIKPAPDQTAAPEEKQQDFGGKTGNEHAADHAEGGRKGGPGPGAAETSSESGRLSAEQVDEVISERLDLFSHCAPADSVISVRATVASDGKVVEVSAARSTPDDARLRDCVVGAFRSLVFPKTQANWPTRLAFDLRLSPQ